MEHANLDNELTDQSFSTLFTEICELYDTFLSPCKPFARAYQTLSVNTKEKHQMTFHYIESYCPSKTYESKTKMIAPSVISVGSPKSVDLACRTIFFGFDEYNLNHQDSLTSALEELKTKLMKLGRKPEFKDKTMSYESSFPFSFDEVGDESIEEQLELVPVYRESLKNLLNLGFDKDLLLEIPKNECTDNYRNVALLGFFVNETERKYLFRLGFWEGFQLEKKEFEKLKEIVTKYKFEISVDDCHKRKTHENISIEELEKICDAIQK